MPIQRVTQNMLTDRSVGALQTGLSKLARLQEQLSTGRILNRPSDSPTEVEVTSSPSAPRLPQKRTSPTRSSTTMPWP